MEKKTIDRLVDALKVIEKVEYIEPKQYLTDGYYSELPHLIQESIKLANESLIHECKPNFDNIEILKKHGFFVYPGEKDSFGWLTGCIRTKKGIIVFG
jgi:hypothetical protein|nr:MAG TPA: hypothetical protein [Caudoviricetes sp.]